LSIVLTADDVMDIGAVTTDESEDILDVYIEDSDVQSDDDYNIPPLAILRTVPPPSRLAQPAGRAGARTPPPRATPAPPPPAAGPVQRGVGADRRVPDAPRVAPDVQRVDDRARAVRDGHGRAHGPRRLRGDGPRPRVQPLGRAQRRPGDLPGLHPALRDTLT